MAHRVAGSSTRPPLGTPRQPLNQPVEPTEHPTAHAVRPVDLTGQPFEPTRGRVTGILLGVLAAGNLLQGLWNDGLQGVLGDNIPKALNLTIISLALLAVVATRYPRDAPKRAVGMPLLLCASFLPGYLPSALNAGTHSKRLAIAAAVIGGILISFRVSGVRRVVPAMLAALFVGAMIILAAQWLLPDSYASLSGRRTPLGVNAIGAGRAMSLGVIVALWYAQRAKGLGSRVAWLATIPLLLGGIVATGSRGPAAGAVIGGILLVLVGARLPRFARFGLVGVGLAALWYAFGELSSAGSRITTSSDSGRIPFLKYSLDVAWAHKLGIGWGNLYNYLPSELVDNEQQFNQYPHNLLVEMFVEGGILGLVALTVVLVVVVLRCLRTDLPERAVLLALFACALVGAMTSSDVVGNQLLWVLAGVILGHTSWRTGRAVRTPTGRVGSDRRPAARPRMPQGRPRSTST